jgi:excisionase family DNA binding protein
MRMRDYLTVDDVARILGRSKKAIHHLVSRGRLPHRRLGRRVIFIRKELEEFLDGLPGMRPADVRKRWRE